MRIYNTLTKKIEHFQPITPPIVGMYTCGPTVYDYVHIGNFRTYTTADFLLRTLQYNNYQVRYIMNITDVGHLTGDNIGDADVGEDRIEKVARQQRKSAWEIARFYEKAFKRDFSRLNLVKPIQFTRATEHIEEQIALVKKLEERGYTYKTSDGVYFDTAKFPEYGKLSSLDLSGIKEGARVPKNPEKRNPTDFALWKFSFPDGRFTDTTAVKRQMEWNSPWGTGFPGWHIECSAMSMKYLGETFDIHLGGEDLAATHHPNEIAQSQAATGKPFVKYWVHGAFMLVDGQRMSKSKGNNYRLDDLSKRGFEAMALRYLYLQTHYRQKMNFTWEALRAARNALVGLYGQISNFKFQISKGRRTTLSDEKLVKVDEYRQKFFEAINSDLNMPQALAVVWEVVKSNIPSGDKYDLLTDFDKVLGLKLSESILPTGSQEAKSPKSKIAKEIKKLIEKREALRHQKKWEEADKIRQRVKEKGFLIEDTVKGPKLRRIKKDPSLSEDQRY